MLLFPVPEKGQLQPQCPTISTRVRIKHSSVGKQLCPFAVRLPVYLCVKTLWPHFEARDPGPFLLGRKARVEIIHGLNFLCIWKPTRRGNPGPIHAVFLGKAPTVPRLNSSGKSLLLKLPDLPPADWFTWTYNLVTRGT